MSVDAQSPAASTLEVEDLVVEVLTERGWATVVDGV